MFSDNYSGSPRLYPLVNKTALAHLTIDDLIRPAEYGLSQSTFLIFQVLLNFGAFFVWIVVVLYFWKIIYYQVDDPYATSLGSSPPNFPRKLSSKSYLDCIWEKVVGTLETWSTKYDSEQKNRMPVSILSID